MSIVDVAPVKRLVLLIPISPTSLKNMNLKDSDITKEMSIKGLKNHFKKNGTLNSKPISLNTILVTTTEKTLKVKNSK